MLLSMTAFGRGECKNKNGRFSVEIQSVNRKYLEINVVLPRQFTSIEPDIRRLIGEKLDRGKVNVLVDIEYNPNAIMVVKPNLSMAKSLLKSYRSIAKELGLDGKIDIISIIRNREVIEDVRTFENFDEFKKAIMCATEKAVNAIRKMQIIEGNAISKDFYDRLNMMKKTLKSLKKNAILAVKKYRNRLIQRIKEITNSKTENDDRILREVAIYADKTDVTEEITRLESHINQFKNYMKSSAPIGRTLDFLVQEMHREINTVGAKSADLDISNSVVLIKSEIEKIREQVQNIV